MHQKRISQGARFLDRKQPDWYRKINDRYLSLTDSGCVIGQAYGSFTDFVSDRYLIPQSWQEASNKKEIARLLVYPGTWMSYIFAVRHGFCGLAEKEYEWRNAWKREIQARLERDMKKDKPLFVPEEWAREDSKSLSLP